MNMFCQLIRGYCAERRICVGHFRSRLNFGLSQKATEHNHPVNHGNRSTRNPPEQLHHGRQEERLPGDFIPTQNSVPDVLRRFRDRKS